MPGGQPHAYNPDEMNPVILDLAENGASLTEICVAIGIVRATAYNWMNPDHDSYNSQFLDVITKAKELSQGWWERQGRVNLNNKEFNSTLFNKQIAGRFPKDWRDSSHIDHTSKEEKLSVTMNVINSTSNT